MNARHLISFCCTLAVVGVGAWYFLAPQVETGLSDDGAAKVQLLPYNVHVKPDAPPAAVSRWDPQQSMEGLNVMQYPQHVEIKAMDGSTLGHLDNVQALCCYDEPGGSACCQAALLNKDGAVEMYTCRGQEKLVKRTAYFKGPYRLLAATQQEPALAWSGSTLAVLKAEDEPENIDMKRLVPDLGEVVQMAWLCGLKTNGGGEVPARLLALREARGRILLFDMAARRVVDTWQPEKWGISRVGAMACASNRLAVLDVGNEKIGSRVVDFTVEAGTGALQVKQNSIFSGEGGRLFYAPQGGALAYCGTAPNLNILLYVANRKRAYELSPVQEGTYPIQEGTCPSREVAWKVVWDWHCEDAQGPLSLQRDKLNSAFLCQICADSAASWR